MSTDQPVPTPTDPTSDTKPRVASKPWFLRLHWQVLAGMLAGGICGLVLGEPFADRVDWIREVFMRLLRMVIVPLIFTSITAGVASVGGGKALGRLFSKTLGYYVISSLLAITAGLFAVNLLKPGVGADLAGAAQQQLPELSTPSSLADILLDIVPRNVFAAASEPNILAVIFFSILLGVSIGGLPEPHRQNMSGFFDAAFEMMMRLTRGVIALLPIGVFAMVAVVVARTGFSSFRALGLYMITIAVALSVHFLITLPLLLRLLGKINPLVHYRNMRDTLLVAFSTSSSGATLPVTLNAVEKQVGVSNRVSSFVLPMGATVNMDGTALYECAGALFIAQALGYDLGIGSQLLVVLTALLASIGAAAIPSAGLVVIFIVLQAVGLEGPQVELMVGAMLAIDRPLDMYRTVVNVCSDSCGAAIIARSEGESDVDTEVRSL